jgi:K+-sensing histidine kinase KdpD
MKEPGIGLSLSKELAELMEGQLTVSSVQGEGSVFVLHFPLQETFERRAHTKPLSVATGYFGFVRRGFGYFR